MKDIVMEIVLNTFINTCKQHDDILDVYFFERGEVKHLGFMWNVVNRDREKKQQDTTYCQTT